MTDYIGSTLRYSKRKAFVPNKYVLYMIGNSSRGLVVSDPLFSYVGGDGHNKSDIERSSGRGNNKRNSYLKNFNHKSKQMVEFN